MFENIMEEFGVPGDFLESAIFFRGDLPHGIEGKTVREFSRRVRANSYNDCSWMSVDGEDNKYGMECEYKDRDLTFLFTYYPAREESRLQIFDTRTGYSGLLFVNARIISDVYLTAAERAEMARKEEEERLRLEEAKAERLRSVEAKLAEERREREAREAERKQREAEELARIDEERQKTREEYVIQVEALSERMKAMELSAECRRHVDYRGLDAKRFLMRTALSSARRNYDAIYGISPGLFSKLDNTKKSMNELEFAHANAKAECATAAKQEGSAHQG